jgi:hypothetical protein
VYVIRTLHLPFHMGNVEWVTCHVPASHSAAGGFSLLVEAPDEFVGERVCVEGCRSSMLEDGDDACCAAGEADMC